MTTELSRLYFKNMRQWIRHKQTGYILLILQAFFLSLPVSHAGDLVLCYRSAGQVEIEFKGQEGCASCTRPGEQPQDPSSCYCVDIPLSREATEHAAIPSSGSGQIMPDPCLSALTSGVVCPPCPGSGFFFSSFFLCTHSVHESLRTTVLLI
ncbi:MAG: hypothetical protein AB1724_06765 [Thermodesulfobacteriota bacterium]